MIDSLHEGFYGTEQRMSIPVQIDSCILEEEIKAEREKTLIKIVTALVISPPRPTLL